MTLAPVTNVFTTTAAGAIETDWLTLWQTSTSIAFVPTVTTVTLPTTLVVLETMTATGAAAAAVTLTSTAVSRSHPSSLDLVADSFSQVSTWTTMVAGPAVTQVVTSTEWLHDTVVSTVVQPATTFVTTLGPVVTSLSTVFANAATTVVSDVISTMTWTEVSTVTMPAASGKSTSLYYLFETDLTLDCLRSHDNVRTYPAYRTPDHHRTSISSDHVVGASVPTSFVVYVLTS